MSKLKPIQPEEFKMKVVVDLGMRKPTPQYYKKVRMATFECTFCKEHFDTVVTTKSKSQTACKQCNGKGNMKPNRDHKLYRIWAGTRSKVISDAGMRPLSYKDKGITFCTEWENYDTFLAWALESGYKEGLSIDRRDNDGNYEPSNCRWVTSSVQAANTRKLRSNNTTGYRGVTNVLPGKYIANIRFEDVRHGLGSFDDPVTAAKTYDYFVLLMGWPHTTNGLLKDNEVFLPTNKTTLKFLKESGIHGSDSVSKEP